MKDIEKFVKMCKTCQQIKSTKYTKMPMVISQASEKPFDKLFMDIVGPLTTTLDGNKYILTIQDDLTRFFDCYAMPDQEANTVARVFFDEIISRYKIPKILLTDQGTQFTSEMFKNTCKLLGIKKLQTTANHPQANGNLERTHATLKNYIKCYIKDAHDTWDKWLRQAAYVYNNSVHFSTKFAPMELLFGFNGGIPNDIKKESEPIYTFENYNLVLNHKLQKAHARRVK